MAVLPKRGLGVFALVAILAAGVCFALVDVSIAGACAPVTGADPAGTGCGGDPVPPLAIILAVAGAVALVLGIGPGVAWMLRLADAPRGDTAEAEAATLAAVRPPRRERVDEEL